MSLQGSLIRCCSNPNPSFDTEGTGGILCSTCSNRYDSEGILAAIRSQMNPGEKSRESVTEPSHTNNLERDINEDSVQAGLQEINDTEANPKNVNFDIPNVLPTSCDLSRNKRCGDIHKLIKYLLSFNEQNPVTCMLEDDVGSCPLNIAQQYRISQRSKLQGATKALKKDAGVALKDDFIKVVRTYFCSAHDSGISSGRKPLRDHFLKLWEDTSDDFDLRLEVWNALRNCKRDVYLIEPSTPQRGRPGLNRGAESVPAKIPRSSETKTLGPDSTIEPPARPWTAQGIRSRVSRPSQSSLDETPSKRNRPLINSTPILTTEVKTPIGRNEPTPIDTASHPGIKSSSQSNTSLERETSGPSTKPSKSENTSFKDRIGQESSLLDKKTFCDDHVEPTGKAKPALEEQTATLSHGSVTGPNECPESSHIKPGTVPSPQQDSNALHEPMDVGTSELHIAPAYSSEGPEPLVKNRSKDLDHKSLEAEQVQSPLVDPETPFARKAPPQWLKRDNDFSFRVSLKQQSQKGIYTPFKGESIFDRLGANTKTFEKETVFLAQDTKASSQPTPFSEDPRDTAPQSITPDIKVQLRKPHVDAFEIPVKPELDEASCTPEPHSSSGTLPEKSKPTAASQVNLANIQMLTVSHGNSKDQDSVVNGPSDNTRLDNLSDEMNNLGIASPLPQTPSVQRNPGSRTVSPSPSGAVHPSCIFPPRSAISTARCIGKILEKSPRGCIYVLEAPEFFSTQFGPSRDRKEIWYKIGITVDVDNRRKSIRSKCGIEDLEEVYSTKPYIRYDKLRVIEAICHQQLNNFRRYLDCGKHGRSTRCSKKHDEWFAVHKDVAVRTVEMWKAFLDHEPYRYDGMLNERWSTSLKNDYVLPKNDGRLSEEELLYQTLEAWIKRTAEG